MAGAYIDLNKEEHQGWAEEQNSGEENGQDTPDGPVRDVRKGNVGDTALSGRGESRPDQDQPPRFFRPARLVLRARQTVRCGEGRATIHEKQTLATNNGWMRV